MSHNEHCGCGCGHDHTHIPPSAPASGPAEVTDSQKDFLHELAHRRFLPLARFTVEDSREKDFISTAMAPVFIRSVSDGMDAVKEAGAFLQRLADMGLVTLDYDLPLQGYGYEEYKQSSLYAYFRATVAEGAAKPGFLGDTPVLELGSIALTEAGARIAAAHCGREHHHE